MQYHILHRDGDELCTVTDMLICRLMVCFPVEVSQ